MHEVARHMRELTKHYISKCTQLRVNKPELTQPVTPVPFDGAVLAVDGGLAHFPLMAVDVVAVRSVAAIFNYKQSQLVGSQHYPAKNVQPKITHAFSLETHEGLIFKSLTRVQSELTCAIQAINQHKPALVLLDGSIAPQLSDKPQKNSELYPKYEETLALYRELFETAAKHNVALAGVVKDTRGQRFCKLAMGEKAETRASDAFLVNCLLKAGERTCEFSYVETPEQHNLLSSLGKWGGEINSFYLRPGLDQPYRVDYLTSSITCDKLASTLSSLSTPGLIYSYPPVLIEADLCAAMNDQLIQNIQRELNDPASLIEMRRNSRPFR